MTTAAEYDGAFQEVFLCGITKKGSGSEYQFAGVVEELTPQEGDKDGEGVALGNGGRMWKRTPEGDFEVTLKIYPLSIDVTDSNDVAQYFMSGTYDTATPITQTNTRGRELFQLVVVWGDSLPATASAQTTSTQATRRITFKHARCTSYKENFDDKMLSVEVTFKGPAFDLDGTGTITRESCKSIDATTLPAVSAYS